MLRCVNDNLANTMSAYSAVSQNVSPNSTARSKNLNRSPSGGGGPQAPAKLIIPKPNAGTFGPFFPSLRRKAGPADILMEKKETNCITVKTISALLLESFCYLLIK